MSVLDFELGLAGLPEKTIAELDKQLPALERIATEIRVAEPLITQLMPHAQKVWPDIVAVTPLVQQLVAFAKSKQGS